jgi:hypothetical protein
MICAVITMGWRATKMWIIFLESALALCIAGCIVWWTWPKKSDRVRDIDEDRKP